jgi:hypothetical protein
LYSYDGVLDQLFVGIDLSQDVSLQQHLQEISYLEQILPGFPSSRSQTISSGTVMCCFFSSRDCSLYCAAKWFDINDKDKDEEPKLQDDFCKQQCTTSDSDDEDISDKETDLNRQLK